MGKLRIGHLVEAGLWLSLCLFLYAYSFEFDRNIEIYKFGASAWPRTIILLMAIAAIGQLVHHWYKGDEASSEHDQCRGRRRRRRSRARSASRRPEVVPVNFCAARHPVHLHARSGLDRVCVSAPRPAGLHLIRIVVAAILTAIVIYSMRHHRVRVTLMLPLFFAALLEDFGFYTLAPFFIIGIMYLFGERRPKPMILIMALIYGLLLLLFVKILFVGLPIGNIRPFYDIGSWVVTVLQ